MPSTAEITVSTYGDEAVRLTRTWDDCSTIAPVPVWSPAPTGARFRDSFERLRERVRLPADKYARLLGASRRTLYHWLKTDHPRDTAFERVELLDGLVGELERYLSSSDLRLQFDPDITDSLGALLVREGPDIAAERAWLIAERAAQPRKARRLEALVGDPHGEPLTASADELRAAFASVAVPRRPARRHVETEPPELNY